MPYPTIQLLLTEEQELTLLALPCVRGRTFPIDPPIVDPHCVQFPTIAFLHVQQALREVASKEARSPSDQQRSPPPGSGLAHARTHARSLCSTSQRPRPCAAPRRCGRPR